MTSSVDMVFALPDGFTVTLMRDHDGNLGINMHMNGEKINFINSQYRLSRKGTLLLVRKILEIYEHEAVNHM